MKLKQGLRQLRKKLAFYNLVGLLNPFYDLFVGGGKRPVFFDIDEIYPSLRQLDRAFDDIKAELAGILPRQDSMPKYHELDGDLIHSSGRYQRDKRWNVFMLYCYGSKPEANRAACPKTSALLDRIPNLSQAFFSILDGGKSIPAHTGPTRGYLRYHLALEVPDSDPPWIRLKDRRYCWKEGESVLFDDSWDHEVVNPSRERRVVLLVDVLRPMPWPAHSVNRLIQAISRVTYGRRILARADAFRL